MTTLSHGRDGQPIANRAEAKTFCDPDRQIGNQAQTHRGFWLTLPSETLDRRQTWTEMTLANAQ